MRLLIMNVQVYSLAANDPFLASKEGILYDDRHAIIKIPLCEARLLNGGPVIGEPYFICYMDGIENSPYGPEFRYIGVINQQLVFSTAPVSDMAKYTNQAQLVLV